MKRVLDHGHLRLVHSMGNDLSVVRAARVSYDAEWRVGDNSENDARLLRYLLRNGHTSPFEHVVFTFDVKAPIFVLRQWMRHRTWSYNEVSGRYTQLPEEFYVPKVENITYQSNSNKQMRTSEQNVNAKLIQEDMYLSMKAAYMDYQKLLSLGTPRELARTVLPVGMYSHMFASVNLHNLLKFIDLRSHEHAQWEIQQYSNAMLELITPVVPECVKVYKELRHGNKQMPEMHKPVKEDQGPAGSS